MAGWTEIEFPKTNQCLAASHVCCMLAEQYHSRLHQLLIALTASDQRYPKPPGHSKGLWICKRMLQPFPFFNEQHPATTQYLPDPTDWSVHAPASKDAKEKTVPKCMDLYMKEYENCILYSLNLSRSKLEHIQPKPMCTINQMHTIPCKNVA